MIIVKERCKNYIVWKNEIVAKVANPQDIMRDFSKTKTSSSWIVVTATMAHWWHQTKRKREGE